MGHGIHKDTHCPLLIAHCPRVPTDVGTTNTTTRLPRLGALATLNTFTRPRFSREAMRLTVRRCFAVAALGLAIAGVGACENNAAPPSVAAKPTLAPPVPKPPFKNPQPGQYLFEDEIRPGMQGFGLTCLRGGKIERFDFEVIDVLQNFMPGNNAILVRCRGLGLEHSGIIAGMSGSPLYIDGKMIGAVSFGFPLGKDPIAGVQPIRQMLAIQPSTTPPAEGTLQALSGPLAAWAKRPGFAALTDNLRKHSTAPTKAAPQAGGLAPLACPLVVSGGSDETLAFLKTALAGTPLLPVACGSATGKPLGGAADIRAGQVKLEPGSSLAIPVVTGDAEMTAVGTVTEVRGDKIYAFGHAMFAEGPSELPIATGYIYTVVPSIMQSFKLGSSLQPQGMLVTDEQAGILGITGRKGRSFPIQVQVTNADGSVNRTFNYQMAPHPRLTPPLLGSLLSASLSSQRGLPRQYTIHLTGEIKFEGGAALTLNMMGTPRNFYLGQAIVPVAMLCDNPFRNLKLQRVDVQAKIESVNRLLRVRAVNVSKVIVAPGDEITATVELEPYQQPVRTATVALRVPANTPDGDYELAVGSGDQMLMQEQQYFPYRFAPENIESLVAAVKNVLSYKSDRLYARLLLEISGAAEHGREFVDLPGSRVALYASEKRTATHPVFNTVQESTDVGGVVEGGQTLSITVDKNANKRFYPARGGGGVIGPIKITGSHRPPRKPSTMRDNNIDPPDPGAGED